MQTLKTRPGAELTVRVATSIADIPAASWDACANPAITRNALQSRDPSGPGQIEAISQVPESGCEPTQKRLHNSDALESGSEHPESISEEDPHNPFVSHAFLLALEQSGCVGGRTGWNPAHLAVENAQGDILACAPTYLKMNSQGEYVFDHAFADAYQRAGGRYYPKIQIAAPFTPATGRRLLVKPGEQAELARTALIAGVRSLMADVDASSIHVTFATKAEQDALTQAGFLPRQDRQFHWFDRDYGTFEGFLAALAARKRKAIRRERRDALGTGITIEWLTGDAITPEHLEAFYSFYMDTGSRKWGRPYLTRAFFTRVVASMADRVLFVMAKRESRYIAGAINFIGDTTLYGRNWGCIEEHPFLHFEVCYYQAIDFALARGLKRVEAGAQGEHKLMRGYEPVPTYSAHDFADFGLKRAVAEYLKRETAHVDDMHEELAELLPFRQNG